MDFTAIDFETANQLRTSACQIGIVVVKNNKIVKEVSSLIKPPAPDFFIKRFTEDIHGITKEMVKDSPTFKDLWGDISTFIEDAPLLVAHNASFDRSVLVSLIDYYKINTTIPKFYCTLRESRKELNHLYKHDLSTISKYFNIPLNHHEALSDARAAANIAITLNKGG